MDAVKIIVIAMSNDPAAKALTDLKRKEHRVVRAKDAAAALEFLKQGVRQMQVHAIVIEDALPARSDVVIEDATPPTAALQLARAAREMRVQVVFCYTQDWPADTQSGFRGLNVVDVTRKQQEDWMNVLGEIR